MHWTAQTIPDDTNVLTLDGVHGVPEGVNA
jgi:hypothetical protein